MLASPVTHYLAPGERLLWSGRPAQGLLFTAKDLLLVPFRPDVGRLRDLLGNHGMVRGRALVLQAVGRAVRLRRALPDLRQVPLRCLAAQADLVRRHRPARADPAHRAVRAADRARYPRLVGRPVAWRPQPSGARSSSARAPSSRSRVASPGRPRYPESRNSSRSTRRNRCSTGSPASAADDRGRRHSLSA